MDHTLGWMLSGTALETDTRLGSLPLRWTVQATPDPPRWPAAHTPPCTGPDPPARRNLCSGLPQSHKSQGFQSPRPQGTLPGMPRIGCSAPIQCAWPWNASIPSGEFRNIPRPLMISLIQPAHTNNSKVVLAFSTPVRRSREARRHQTGSRYPIFPNAIMGAFPPQVNPRLHEPAHAPDREPSAPGMAPGPKRPLPIPDPSIPSSRSAAQA